MTTARLSWVFDMTEARSSLLLCDKLIYPIDECLSTTVTPVCLPGMIGASNSSRRVVNSAAAAVAVVCSIVLSISLY